MLMAVGVKRRYDGTPSKRVHIGDFNLSASEVGSYTEQLINIQRF